MKRADIVTEARKWVETPFLHQGRNEAGIDCVGMVQRVGDVFHVPYDDLQGYARAPTDPKFLKHLRQYLNAAPISGDKHGLVGVCRQSIYPCHIGIFATDKGCLTFINARADRGEVVEEEFKGGTTLIDFKLIQLLAFPGLED